MSKDPIDRRSFLGAGAALAAAAATVGTAQAQATGGRVTAHVLDLYTGSPANGIRIDFSREDGGQFRQIKSVITNADGRPPEGPLLTADQMAVGIYQAALHIGDYYKNIGAKLPSGYHTKLTIEFRVYDAKEPHHIPFQITPWTQATSVLPG
jgi:5-hydroxyisourate hydrolase